VSNDRALKVWNIREMMYMDSHYGHLSDILDIDKYSKDRVMSCGLDRQVIFWKVNEDSELIYRNPEHFTDSLNILSNHFFLTSSITENCLDLWVMNKKRPVNSLLSCHTENSLLLSTAALRNTDLIASGGTDGYVNLYKFDKDKKKLAKMRSIDGLKGCLNNLKFSNTSGRQVLGANSVMLAVSHSEE
jgi:ribosomal RNA-processing protein 9